MEHEPKFVYAKPCSLNSIRLLKLSFKDGNCDAVSSEAVRLSMSEFELQNAPTYTALSYTWGEPGSLCPVVLNGAVFLVRKNLRQFFEQIQEERDDRHYWIDAICINQDDIKERNYEVSIMGHIYAQAESVVAWLGSSPRSQMNFVMLQSNVEMFGHETQVARDEAVRNACREILLLDYWCRLWVIQEMALAKELYVKCGPTCMPYHEFEKVRQSQSRSRKKNQRRPKVMTGSTIPGKSRISESMLRAQNTLDFISKYRLKRRRKSLLTLLLEFKDHSCADPKDRVFGLLGIQKNTPGMLHSTPVLEVQYERSLCDLYWDATFSSILRADFPSLLAAQEALSGMIDLQVRLCPDLKPNLISSDPVTSNEPQDQAQHTLSVRESFESYLKHCPEGFRALCSVAHDAQAIRSSLRELHVQDKKVIEPERSPSPTAVQAAFLLGLLIGERESTSQPHHSSATHLQATPSWRCDDCQSEMKACSGVDEISTVLGRTDFQYASAFDITCLSCVAKASQKPIEHSFSGELASTKPRISFSLTSAEYKLLVVAGFAVEPAYYRDRRSELSDIRALDPVPFCVEFKLQGLVLWSQTFTCRFRISPDPPQSGQVRHTVDAYSAEILPGCRR